MFLTIGPRGRHADLWAYSVPFVTQIHYTGLFLPWHRAYINDFEAALRAECNYRGAWPYWNWTLGRLARLRNSWSSVVLMFRSYLVDASPNFRNATIFNDSPTSGLGGWGDPNDDYQITTGAFAHDFEVAYPVPHRIRRNYTLTVDITDPFGDGTPPPPGEVWKYFTPASQKKLIQGYIGDFEGFHADFESVTVS